MKLIFGEFNIHVTVWGNPLSFHSVRNLYTGNNLLKSVLTQHVNKLTRGYNILDIVFSTNDSLISNIMTGPLFSINDHRIVTFDLNLKIYEKNGSDKMVYVYSKGNYDRLKKYCIKT